MGIMGAAVFLVYLISNLFEIVFKQKIFKLKSERYFRVTFSHLGFSDTGSTQALSKRLKNKCIATYTTARRSNQSMLKEISPENSLEGLMLKLKLQYFSQLCEELTHLKRPRCWEKLKEEGKGDDKG